MTFIVIDGVDGCGKSTQAKILADRIGALHLQDPGTTDVGKMVRAFVKDPTKKAQSEPTVLLFAAARAELSIMTLQGVRADGRTAVCERWTSSTLVYQGILEGFSPKAMKWIDEVNVCAEKPDITIILDVPTELAFARVAKRVQRDPDRFDERDMDFFQEVRCGFLELAAVRGWKVIDGTGTMAEVSVRIKKVVGR